jgi:diadenosine tetraphosphate (Ap4A) HIT family hydrolase
LKITGAYRINYAILGNCDPVLHAHIIPRYASEPEEYLHELPWSYLNSMGEKLRYDYIRDRALIEEIASALC